MTQFAKQFMTLTGEQSIWLLSILEMSIQAALSLFVEEYPLAVSRPFAGDSVADFIRSEVPETIESIVSNPRYTVEGSAGKGRWANVPWVAVFDSLITVR